MTTADPAVRLAELKDVLVRTVAYLEDPSALEGRGDVVSFRSSLEKLAQSIDEPKLKRPWWCDE